MLKRLLPVLSVFLTSIALANTHFADQPSVQLFIQKMVMKNHFQKAELVSLFNTVRVRPKIISSIKAPLEKNPWHAYQRLFVTEWRIREGVKFWNKYRSVLSQAEKQFGVPANIIVATIGVETKFGRRVGDYRVIDALANLSFNTDSTRSNYFIKELEEFLLLSREQQINPQQVLGSYAGAIGQPQFMPSSYRHYAINFSRSGKIDLSHNVVDIIGSVANYYNKHGWKANQIVALPASIKTSNTSPVFYRGTFSKLELKKYAIVSKKPIPDHQKIKIIQLDSYLGTEYWLGFHNFDVIKRYNNSDLYAMAVYQLSYYISALRERKHNV